MIQQPRPAPLTCWEKVGVCCGCVASHGLALVSNEVQEHVEANLLPGATVRGYRARALLFPHENRGSRIGTLHVMLIEAAGVKNCDACFGTNAFATLRLGAQWQRSLTKSVVSGIKDVASFKDTRHRIAFGDQFVYDAFDGTPVLVLELWDEDYKVKVELGNKKAQLGKDDYIGRCFVPLTTLVDHRAVDRWYKLEGKGKVRLRLLFKPAGVMHCDGACTSEIALVGMVEADEYATGRKLALAALRVPRRRHRREVHLCGRGAALRRARARRDRRAQRVLGGLGDAARVPKCKMARGQIRQRRLGD